MQEEPKTLLNENCKLKNAKLTEIFKILQYKIYILQCVI
jgi:hypothetical protein